MATRKKIPRAPRWDLDSIFPGGSKSTQYKDHRDKVKDDLEKTRTMLAELPAVLDDNSLGQWVNFILKLQELYGNTILTVSFATCLSSQDVSDTAADAIVSEGNLYLSQWQKLVTELEARSLKQTDEMWARLLADPRLAEIRFFLDEMRTIAKSKMPVELESLALDLAVSGYHAWYQLYEKMAGELRVDFEIDGKVKQISVGQLAAKMADPNRTVRRKAFEKMTEAWRSRADLAAMALNAQAGFRLALYDNRKWESPLYEPLVIARMRQETLDTMWRVIARETKRLKPYIEAKKKLLRIDKFRWYDEFAACGKADKLYTFDEAGDFCVRNARDFSDDMADFFRAALDKRWIEAEDRPGKRGGGYCTGMGPFRQSRIFMTYTGTYENLLTVAHELGHAYHGYVLRTKPFLATIYPMNLAETASTFAEALVTDAALERCDDPDERLMLLEQKLQATYIMFCDIHCRYLFDKAFYAERKKGMVGKDRLSEIMVESQKKAFRSLLDPSGYHPLFWCSKLHFYITDAPFYNFPYTFGYLFAGGVYDRARKEGKAFADKYRALLADTGSMTTEDLARKHLDVDLTEEKFWVDAVNRALADVAEFVKLAGQPRTRRRKK
jgi:oligoendopeptidase F